MVVVVCLMIVVAVLLIVVLEIIKIREIEQENQLMKACMMSMEGFYADIQLKMETIRKYRHDLKKHIQTLEMLSENHVMISEEMEEYTNTLKQQYKRFEKEENDGFISFLLSIKKKECERKQIPVEIVLDDNNYDKFEEIDLVSLIHNLFDNAIEENERIKTAGDRGIYFSMKKENDHVVIDMKNKIVEGEKITFLTKKDSYLEHGIGMKIIKSIVEKYNGSRKYKIDETESMFQDQIILF